MRTGIPNGLTQLLGRLGLGGKPETKATENALTARAPDKSAGLLKGTALANGAVLAGLGHNPDDKHTGTRNRAERENINRFMQEAPLTKKGEAETAQETAAKGESLHHDAHEMRETKELREEMRRDERIDDAKGVRVQEEKTEKETRSSVDAKEREREREEERDEDRPGGAWLEEELDRDEDESPRRRGQLRQEDALGSAMRCHGQLSEGSRCLRKPVPGTPYCREHAVVLPRTPSHA